MDWYCDWWIECKSDILLFQRLCIILFRDIWRYSNQFFICQQTKNIKWSKIIFCQGIHLLPELENVKSFTRTNINKPDFTPRKARKSRHFWHFKPTKQNLWGFLWWINVDKLSIYGSLSIDLKFFAHIFPKMACFW